MAMVMMTKGVLVCSGWTTGANGARLPLAVACGVPGAIAMTPFRVVAAAAVLNTAATAAATVYLAALVEHAATIVVGSIRCCTRARNKRQVAKKRVQVRAGLNSSLTRSEVERETVTIQFDLAGILYQCTCVFSLSTWRMSVCLGKGICDEYATS